LRPSFLVHSRDKNAHAHVHIHANAILFFSSPFLSTSPTCAHLLGGGGPRPVLEEASEHGNRGVRVLLDVLHDAIAQLLVVEPHAPSSNDHDRMGGERKGNTEDGT